MDVDDPGHLYNLRSLDGHVLPFGVSIQFVKREGEGYPGNIGHYAGTTTQEVLRVLIDRTKYVNNQIYDHRNILVIQDLRSALYNLELRAAERHGRLKDFRKLMFKNFDNIENMSTCDKCGHIGCKGDCH